MADMPNVIWPVSEDDIDVNTANNKRGDNTALHIAAKGIKYFFTMTSTGTID